MDNPLNALGIAVAFLIFMFSIQFIRKNDAGWAALLAVIPIAVLYSVMSVISKIALEQGELAVRYILEFCVFM